MQYRVFYCDYARDEQIAADGARPHELPQILALMDAVLTSPGSFVGVIDPDGGILQVFVADDGGLVLDFPVPNKRGSYHRRASLERCKRALCDADGRFHPDAVEGLDFERW
jgi:hypothetical protein